MKVPKLKIPVFPLNVVLLPALPLPLHIFEERYKQMIGECLKNESEFGIVLMEGRQMRKIGCTAKIVQVLKRFDDGRMDILTVGKNRFTIMDISEEKQYLESNVELFDDFIEDDSPEMDALKEQGLILLKKLENKLQKSEGSELVRNMDSRTLSFILGGSSVISAGEKQELLEMKVTSERLHRSVELLQDAIIRVQLIENIKKLLPEDHITHGFSKN